jgi:hypothetical protein
MLLKATKAIDQTRIQQVTQQKRFFKINQSNENSNTKKGGIKHTKAGLGLSFKKKWESEVMLGQCYRPTAY